MTGQAWRTRRSSHRRSGKAPAPPRTRSPWKALRRRAVRPVGHHRSADAEGERMRTDPAPNVQPPPTWKKFARACSNGKVSLCESGGTCVQPTPETQFKQCISHEGKGGLSKCPPEYPERSIFMIPSPMAAPARPVRAARRQEALAPDRFRSSPDGACSISIGSSLQIDAVKAPCVDLLPGAALGSKSASEPVFAPGQCAPQFDATKPSPLPLKTP